MEYVYSKNDLIEDGCSWREDKVYPKSKFDRLICNGWDEAVRKGCFRYTLDGLKSRVVPGRHGYVIQLNMKRGVERRKPEYIDSLKMPFNPEKFNFTKVRADEILFKLVPQNGILNSKEKHLLLVNVSPLEYGHVLLVPEAESGIPQRLTERGLQLAVEMLLLSSHPGFRVGFNSLCALASVNHQHVHGWYLEESIMTEYAPVEHVFGPVYEMVSMPTKCFTFQLHGNVFQDLIGLIYRILCHFHENEIAHNLFITRGPQFGKDRNSRERTVRIYLWPRLSVIGTKNEEGLNVFNVAVAELAGHIPMYVPERFDSLTEEEINAEIAKHMFSDEEYTTIKQDIIKLLKNMD